MKKTGSALLFLCLGFALALLVYLYQATMDKERMRIQAQQDIASLGRIILFEQHYRSILAIENSHQFLGITFARNRMLLGVPYRVRYGIDMSKGVRLEPKGRTLTIYHPAAEIFDIDVINHDIETFTTSGKIRIDDFMPLIQKERENLREQLPLEYSQLAQTNLHLFFKEFLAPLGYAEIKLKEIHR